MPAIDRPRGYEPYSAFKRICEQLGMTATDVLRTIGHSNPTQTWRPWEKFDSVAPYHLSAARSILLERKLKAEQLRYAELAREHKNLGRDAKRLRDDLAAATNAANGATPLPFPVELRERTFVCARATEAQLVQIERAYEDIGVPFIKM
jgi:hypothetical protein